MKSWILAACCAISLGAARPITPFSGTFPAHSITEIVAAGDLVVRGRKSDVIRYTVASASERVVVGSGRLMFPESASVRLEVPRCTRFLALSSAGGLVDAADIDGSV